MDPYALADGKPIPWDEEECTAMTLTGSSKDIAGTWKGDIERAMEANASSPAPPSPS